MQPHLSTRKTLANTIEQAESNLLFGTNKRLYRFQEQPLALDIMLIPCRPNRDRNLDRNADNSQRTITNIDEREAS